MPRAPLKPCPKAGCPSLISRKERYCPTHTRVEDLAYDATRGTAASRGYDARHRAWRKAILARDPFCKIGMKCGGSAQSTVADHITPLRQGGGWGTENGQGCCEPCHNWKRATSDKGR
jgi:5-methylcytosine-specific restriction protein A